MIANSPYVYEVVGYLTQYPAVSSNAQSTITLLDPCDSPFSLTVGGENDIQSDYSGIVTFTFPTITVVPSVCLPERVFSCEVQSTPAAFNSANFDLCANGSYSNNGYNTVTNFNTNTGAYQFNSNDKANFPPGKYVFKITVTIGDKSVEVIFDMDLINPCSTATITINQNPFNSVTPFIYEIGSASSLDITYNQATLVSTTTTVDCGPIVINFYQQNGAPYDTTVFSEDRVNPSASKFITGTLQTTQFAKAGDYPLRWKAHF